MQTRQLGRSGLAIAPLVFGGNVFGWTADEATSFAMLDRFTGRGFNAVDTADVYSAWAPGLSGGESETVIGNWLARRGRRDDIVLMTKVGKLASREGLSAANIQAAVEDSLKRLRTDYLDVYFAHADDDTVPLEETLAAFTTLVEAGKVRAIGASNYSAGRMREALQVAGDRGLARYELMQPGYNLYDRAVSRPSPAPPASGSWTTSWPRRSCACRHPRWTPWDGRRPDARERRYGWHCRRPGPPAVQPPKENP